MKLFADTPISAIQFDALGRKDVATRVVELVAMTEIEQPVVIGLVGPSGCGKTSVVHMTSELLADPDRYCAFTLDAWHASDAKRINDSFVREISRIFTEAKVASSTDKLRDRLFSLGDMVSTVARVAGVTVDVKGALERTPDQLREEVTKLTAQVGKRIVVFIDHLDRLPGAEVIAVLKHIERWGTFPYFAFVIAYDGDQVAHNVRHTDGDTDALERIITTELPMPPVDRDRLAAWLRGGLADLAASLGVDPAPALALFEVDGGAALELVTTVRHAKRLLNALDAVAPLMQHLDLRTLCALELVRQHAPAIYKTIVARLPLDPTTAGKVRAEIARDPHAYPPAVDALVEQLVRGA